MRRALSLIRKRNQILCERAVCALLIWIQNLRSQNLRGRIIMSGEEQPHPFASDEEMNSESSRAPDGARHILPIIIEEPEPISSDEEMLTDFPSPFPPPCGSRKYRASPWRKGVTLCSNQKGGRENDGSGNGPLSGWNRAANTVLRRA
ncbi:uncharacterized protein LOC101863488 isoform X3 [Aplysia californica]|uniref:Uncharacterized protein LOC101863488 isoform X3 n=1 Tax=Aplysia californica TaxID=6500 RepID=A0ABM1AF53_APLCA|nr:uncharacterized protein LOC101863488 isoform X3 [Aplysia californica]